MIDKYTEGQVGKYIGLLINTKKILFYRRLALELPRQFHLLSIYYILLEEISGKRKVFPLGNSFGFWRYIYILLHIIIYCSLSLPIY